MANPFYQSHTTTGAKTPWNSDWMSPTTTTIETVVVSGTAQYSVEFTLDDLNDLGTTPRWVAFADAPVGTSTTKAFHVEYPVRFVRINIAVITGTVEFKIIQGMYTNS